MASEAPHPPAGAIPIAGAQPKVFANHQHLSKLAALIAPKPMGPGGKPIVKPAPPPDVEVKLEHLTAARPRAAAKKRRPAAKPTFSAGGETKEEAEEEPAPAIKVTVAAPVQPAALAPSPSLQSLPNPAPSPANKAAEAAVAPLDSDLVDVTPQNVANVIRTLTREVAVLEQSVAELRAQQRGLHAQLAQLHTQALSMGHDAPGPIPFPDDKRTAVQAMQAAANKVFKAGWITKEGSTVRNWKKRYFILYSDHIDYYENPRSDGKPLGSIDLRGCKVSPLKVRAGVGKPCIEVTLAERRWHFFAETPRENTSWFSAISNRAETLAYVHRCDKAKTAPNAVILDFLNRYNSENFGGVGEHLRIHNQPLALDSVALLARMISDPSQFSTPIRVLELVNCGLKDVDFGVLMDSLATNNTVTHLLVKGNPISAASCKNIAQVLASRASHLQHLMIEECPITDAGVALLLPTLKASRLKRLQLVACSLSAASAKQLAHIIGSREEAPATLIELVLDGNAIADEGANALSSMLATAPSLLSLSAKDCGFTDAAATALAEALHARGVRLSSLLVNGPRNAFSASGSQQLAAAVQTTPSLQSAAFSQYALSQTELSVLQLISAYGFASPIRA